MVYNNAIDCNFFFSLTAVADKFGGVGCISPIGFLCSVYRIIQYPDAPRRNWVGCYVYQQSWRFIGKNHAYLFIGGICNGTGCRFTASLFNLTKIITAVILNPERSDSNRIGLL